MIATNKAAGRDYTILESLEAGIELRGSEVKSLRLGRADLRDSFARIEAGEVRLYNMHISPYEYAKVDDEEPKRVRRLLLHKSQIRKLIGKTKEKGFTLIPLKVYFRQGLAKVELALAKGKRLYDRREELKRKEAEREIRRRIRKKW